MVNLFVLDTDTLSLLERGDQAIYAQIQSHKSAQIATSVITVEEQMQGRLRRIREATTREAILIAYRQLASTTEALRHLNILRFEDGSVDRYTYLWSLKLNVGKNDLRIAAIALENNGTVVTRNRRDFERVPGLTVEDWSIVV